MGANFRFCCHACCVLLLWLALGRGAGAQDSCTADIEPNDQIEQAASVIGATCFEGMIEPGKQDRFIWSVKPDEGAHGWELSFEGGYRNSRIILQAIKPASGTEARSEGAELLRLDTANGAYRGRTPEFLVVPGEYLVSILSEGASPYRVRFAATVPAARESEPNDAAEQASPLLAGTVVSGDLHGQPDFFRIAITEAGARRHWIIEINGSLGQWIAAELLRADGQSILTTGGTLYRPLEIADLGLVAGDYFLKLSPTSDTALPYTVKLSPGGPRVPSRESEPNDALATAAPLALGKTTVGRLGRSADIDVFALDVGQVHGGKLLSLALKSRVDRTLCLTTAAGGELQCRSGAEPELSNLALPPGRYGVSISGGADPDQTYALTARIAGARRQNSEAEPNDRPEFANALAASHTLQAQLGGADVDLFALQVEGPPQLWTIKAAGGGVESVIVTNYEQVEIGSGESIEGAAGASAVDVFLLPGDYIIKVSGKGGTYALTATPTGPPDLSAEREPNDTDAQAQRLAFGVVRSGRLSDSTDRDVYRFSLFAADHILLKVEPAAGDEISVELEWGYPSPRRPQGITAAEPFFYDALLDPGDYIVRLRSARRSSSPYRIELARANAFVLPDDLEPNDTPGQARDLPASLTVEGKVVSYLDVDWFALPPLARPTKMTVQVTGNVEPSVVDGTDALAGSWQAETHLFEAMLPAERALRLGIKGEGGYSLKLSFADGPPPVAAAQPLPLDLGLRLDQPSVAAFWIRGQRVNGAIELSNTGQATLDLALDVVSSHFAYRPDLGVRTITLAPGARQDVPFDVVVGPDAWASQRVDLVARASAADGGSVTAIAGLVADPVVPPVGQEISFPLPQSLLGGFNVAGSALGGIVSLPEGDASGEKPGVLQDGLVGDAKIGAFVIPAAQLPYVLTSRFGTEHPWNVAGFTIHPQAEGRLYPAEQLKDFELLLSQDGVTFQTALTSRLSMLPIEQAFVLDRPVAARAAQLRLKSNHADNVGLVGLSEWKVIAVPGEPQGLVADIAEWERGGHVVWNTIVVGSSPEDERAMLGAGRSVAVKIPGRKTPEWVLGFHENRAAQIDALEWVGGDVSASQQAFMALVVSASTDGTFGPWRDLGRWELKPDAGGTTRWTLPEPVWARFIRFAATEPASEEKLWVYPKALRIFERPTGAGYLSILGEWGQYNRNAIFEASKPVPPLPALATASERGKREQAETLPIGETASGEVRLNEVEDWYAIDVPAGVNRLTLTASGEPTVDVDLELEQAGQGAVPLASLPSAADQLNFEAHVEGGSRYLVRVHEPRRSVAIAYDTSPSISHFAPIIRHALAAFAAGVKPGREFVNFMNFESPFMLKEWTDQPWVLEGAVLARPGADQKDSSDLEATLASILDAFARRRGVKAAIIVTDAETPGFDRQPDVWENLARLRPRIFAAHIGAGGDPRREKQLMQDLASVNGGYYASARTQAEIDVVSERAAAWLRRPTRYQLSAAVRDEAPPLPGTLEVVAAALEPGAEPAALQNPEAHTPPPGGAVEIILDASGSMLQRLQGQRRIEIARKVLAELATETLIPGQLVALRVFGDDRPESCETRLAMPLGPHEPKPLVKRIKAIAPKNLARTPIGASLRAVANDLADAKGQRTVILVTDGEETCGGDPEREIAGLRAQGFDVRVNIVGFAVDDAGLKETFRKWAEVGGGNYFDAGDAEELGTAVRAALQLPYRVVDAAGTVVASGTIGGPVVTLAPATYRVEVGTASPFAIENVIVMAGQPTRISYEAR